MLALFSRILKLSGKYKSRIQGAFLCAFTLLYNFINDTPVS